MTIGTLDTFINLEELTSKIIHFKSNLIVLKTITEEYIVYRSYVIKNGNDIVIMVGDDNIGYMSLGEVIEKKMVRGYGLLNE